MAGDRRGGGCRWSVNHGAYLGGVSDLICTSHHRPPLPSGGGSSQCPVGCDLLSYTVLEYIMAAVIPQRCSTSRSYQRGEGMRGGGRSYPLTCHLSLAIEWARRAAFMLQCLRCVQVARLEQPRIFDMYMYVFNIRHGLRCSHHGVWQSALLVSLSVPCFNPTWGKQFFTKLQRSKIMQITGNSFLDLEGAKLSSLAYLKEKHVKNAN